MFTFLLLITFLSSAYADHWCVTGSTSWGSSGSQGSNNKPDECVEDSRTTGDASNQYEDELAVQCCRDYDDGSVQFGRYFDKDGSTTYCYSGVDYETAKDLCEGRGDRLCTKAEALADLPRHDGSGCSFDAYHVWTSDRCGDLCGEVDIDGYLTRCSNVFDTTSQDVGGLRSDVDANTAAIAVNEGVIGSNTDNVGSNKADIDGNRADIDGNTAAIEEINRRLALIKDIGGAADGQESTLFDLNIGNENYVLLFSLFANIMLAIFAYFMYNKIKNNKQYSKVNDYIDSDAENQSFKN